MRVFTCSEKLAQVAPSITLWSQVYEKLTISTGLKELEDSSHFGYLCDLPIATIAPYGQRMVGTKYLPPRLPTLDTVNVPFAKSSFVKDPFAALSLSCKSSSLILTIDLS